MGADTQQKGLWRIQKTRGKLIRRNKMAAGNTSQVTVNLKLFDGTGYFNFEFRMQLLLVAYYKFHCRAIFLNYLFQLIQMCGIVLSIHNSFQGNQSAKFPWRPNSLMTSSFLPIELTLFFFFEVDSLRPLHTFVWNFWWYTHVLSMVMNRLLKWVGFSVNNSKFSTQIRMRKRFCSELNKFGTHLA